jgi:hypothetical protein
MAALDPPWPKGVAPILAERRRGVYAGVWGGEGSEAMAQTTYRACLIGCGRMGATIDDEVRDRPDSLRWLPYSHAAACTAIDRVDLVAVADVVPEKVEEIKRRYAVPRGYTDYRELIRSERPDILCIATRPGPHEEQVIFAAENGVRAIYCEKPPLLLDGGGGPDGGGVRAARRALQLWDAASLQSRLPPHPPGDR